MGPLPPYRSLRQDRQASLTPTPIRHEDAALASKPYKKSPTQYFDHQPASDGKLTASEIGDGKRPTSLPITGGSFEPSVPLEGKDAIWFVVSRAARLHGGPSVTSRVTHPLPGRDRIESGRPRARLVSSVRSRDIATGMRSTEVLSPGDPWSWSDAARGARLAKPHTSGARCSKAEACKLGQETKTPNERSPNHDPNRAKELVRPTSSPA